MTQRAAISKKLRHGENGTSRGDSAIRTAQALARRLDPDPPHAFQVAKLALVLFDATMEFHALGPKERRLLHLAALTHDTGHSVDMLLHHKRARDIILAHDLEGVSRNEHRVIACVARYHRKAHPLGSHKIYRDLDPLRQQIVRKLAALLRIADGLDRSHTASARDLRVDRVDAGVRISVDQRTKNSTDIWGANRKRGLFEEVFGVPVEIVAVEEDAPPPVETWS